MLEDKMANHYRTVVDKFHNPVADYQMTTRDYVVRPSAGPATGAITITLPPVAEAKGRLYSILAYDADVGNTVTIADRDDSEYWLADIVLNGPGDRVLLYSDGICWHPIGAAGPGAWPGAATTAAPGVTTVAPTTARPDQTTAAPTTAAPSSTAAPTTAGA